VPNAVSADISADYKKENGCTGARTHPSGDARDLNRLFVSFARSRGGVSVVRRSARRERACNDQNCTFHAGYTRLWNFGRKRNNSHF